MSVYIMSEVWKYSPHASGTFIVELALADFSNDDGECWCKIATLAKKSRLTERQVQYALSSLIKSGGVRKTRTPTGERNCNTYQLTPEIYMGAIFSGEALSTQGVQPTSPPLYIDESLGEPPDIEQTPEPADAGQSEGPPVGCTHTATEEPQPPESDTGPSNSDGMAQPQRTSVLPIDAPPAEPVGRVKKPIMPYAFKLSMVMELKKIDGVSGVCTPDQEGMYDRRAKQIWLAEPNINPAGLPKRMAALRNKYPWRKGATSGTLVSLWGEFVGSDQPHVGRY